MSDPSYELQDALHDALKNNIGPEVGPRIYDNVPTNATFPYVTIGDGQVLADKADCIDGTEHFLQIDVWSRAVGYPEAKTISNNILAVLDDKPPPMDGYVAVIFELENIQYLRDPDGLTRHVAMTFHARIQPYDAPPANASIGAAAGSGSASGSAVVWQTDFTYPLTVTSASWNGFNLRQVINGSRRLYSGSKVRCTLQAAVGSGFTIDHAEIGHAAAAGDPYDFDGTQIAMTFAGGNAGVVVGAGQTVLSDEMNYSIDVAKNFIVAVHFSAASQIAIGQAAGAGVTSYSKSAANEVSVSDVTGYSAVATSVYLVNKIEVAGAAAGTGDPYFASVKLLLGFEGADGSTVITDESPVARGNATISGNAQIDTAQFKYGASSLLLDGTGDSLQWPSSADWRFGAGTFTVETWVRPNTVAAGNAFIVSQWLNAPNLGWVLSRSGAVLNWNVSTTGSDNLMDMAGGTLITGVWQAVCVDYDGSKYRMYLNGVMVASSTTPRNIFPSTLVLSLGSNAVNGAFFFDGWIDEVRITKGVARYASDAGYTVPTAAFPRFVATVVAATWDAATVANMALSGGNLVATTTSSSTATAHVAIGTGGKATGKYYFEVTLTQLQGGVFSADIGISATGVQSGNRAYVDCSASGGNIITQAGTALTGMGGGSTSTVYAVAVDLDNLRIWFRKGAAGNWNANASNNPATNVGGVTLVADTYVPYVRFNGGTVGSVDTANFGASAFVGAVPAGFTSGWPA